MKIIKLHHVEKLLKKFDMGTQILFEDKLQQWRESIQQPLETHHSSGLKSPSTPSRSSPYLHLPSPQSDFSQPPSPQNRIYLSDILNEMPKGLKLCRYYEEKQSFQEEQRVMLINLIARYFDERELHLTLAMSYKLEEEIIDRFPSEKKVNFKCRITFKKYIKITCFFRNFIALRREDVYTINYPI